MATASMVCGFLFFIFPTALIAIILGHIALSEIKKSGGRIVGEGRAIAGLVLGYAGIAFIPLILIVAAIAIPNLLRSRIAANEAAAVGSVRTINTAEYTYSNQYRDIGFTCRLEDMSGTADDCRNASRINAQHACLITEELASGQKMGYQFSIENCAGDQGPNAHYEIIARPLQQDTSGRKTFCSDETGVIKTSSERTIEACLTDGTPLR